MRYGGALLSLAAAFYLAANLESSLNSSPHASILFCAVIFSTWFGGVGPGLMVTLLSIFLFDFCFLYPYHTLVVNENEVPRLAVFSIAALLIWLMGTSQRSAARSLREAQEELTAKMRELEKSNEALRLSEGYLAEAQELTHCGSWVWNYVERKVLYWSQEMYRIYESDPAKGPLEEADFEAILGPEQWQRRVSAFERAARDGSDVDILTTLTFPNGLVKYLRLVAHPRPNARGEVIEFIGTSMDITDRRLTQDALDKAQADLAHISRMTTMGEMTASIAHEVNQPLTAVANNAHACLEWLSRRGPEFAEIRDALGEIVEDIERAGAVMDRVRSLAKKAPFTKTVLDLCEVVHDVLSLARYDLATRQVSVRTELPDCALPIAGDRVQLQQVLLNLVVNGMDAMAGIEPEQRVLTISVDRDGKGAARQIRLRVRDAGVGLPADGDRLFEAFYTTKPQGLGMGLAISRSIIEAHEGRLRAEANPGSGATFVLSLPEAGAGA